MSDETIAPYARTEYEPPDPPPARTWAMLAYIAGDNDLSAAGLADIDEMCSVGSSSDVYAAVEIDTAGDWLGSIRYEIGAPTWDGHAYRTVIQRVPEQDSGDSTGLHEFAKWAGYRYPARHRLVAVWGHDSGFRGNAREMAFDDRSGWMLIPQLARALRRAELGRIAIIGFDACTMAMVEIAHELDDVADYLVASQALVPGEGWPYDWVLYDMLTLPEPEALARSIVTRFVDVHGSGPEPATQSAIALRRIAATHEAVQALGDELEQRLPMHRTALLLARDQAQSYDRFTDHVDLVDLCEQLAAAAIDEVLTRVAQQTAESAARAIVHAAHSDPSVARSHGLSIWFPRSPYTFYAERGEYVKLRGNTPGTGWVKFLDALYDV